MIKKIFLFLLLSLCTVSSSFSSSSEDQTFSNDLGYTIYYAVTDNKVAVVKEIGIVKIITLGEKKFLKIESSKKQFKQEKGYINLEKIIAIFPNDKIVPQ